MVLVVRRLRLRRRVWWRRVVDIQQDGRFPLSVDCDLLLWWFCHDNGG